MADNSLCSGRLPCSVVITTHNKAPYLREAVASAHASNVAEVIIVDDASTDHSLLEAQRLAQEFPRTQIRALTRNAGAAGARNAGFELVRTPWVCFLDGDDRLTQGAVSHAIAIAQQTGASIVSGWAQMFGAESKLWQPQKWDPYYIRYDNSIPACCLVSSAKVKEVSGYNSALPFAEDWDLWIRISQTLPNVIQIDRTFYEYRRSNVATSQLSSFVDDNWNLTAPLMMLANQSFYNIEDLKFAVEQFIERGRNWDAALNKHQARHPDAPLLMLLRALLAEGNSNISQAIELYVQVLSKDATNPIALWRLGRLLTASGRADAGYQILHQARISRPDMSFIVAGMLNRSQS